MTTSAEGGSRRSALTICHSNGEGHGVDEAHGARSMIRGSARAAAIPTSLGAASLGGARRDRGVTGARLTASISIWLLVVYLACP